MWLCLSPELKQREYEFAAKFMKDLGGVGGDATAATTAVKEAGDGGSRKRSDWPSGADLEDLHKLLRDIGLAPHFGGMQFVKIRHKGYLWVSKEEAEAFAEETPMLAYLPGNGPA